MKVHEFVYSAAFVRDLDYYTGFVFEAVDAAVPQSRPASAAGGMTASRATWAR